MSDVQITRALYNRDCPVCNSEMCAYSAYARSEELPLAFDDLNQIDLAQWGVSEDEATRLLHVLHEGQLYIGFDAVLILWEQMPKYRWMARVGRLPVLNQVLNWGYAHMVARIIYARHKRRQARGLIRA